MRHLDHLLQRWRGRLASRWVPSGAVVLDIGCHRGEFLGRLGGRIGPSVGIDPLADPRVSAPHRLLAIRFREPLPLPDGAFDVVTLLASLEHLRDKPAVARETFRLLQDGGRLILTVPSARVDAIAGALRRMGLVDGMCLEDHHGFDSNETVGIFASQGLVLEHWGRFQLGLNNLFVFRKPGLRRHRVRDLATAAPLSRLHLSSDLGAQRPLQ
jgi:SAM-dependent methyltransferase